MTVLAHGLGGRSDLPIPLWMALYGGASALIISFFALGVFWSEPRLQGARAGQAIPDSLQRFIDSRPLRGSLRSLGLAALFLTAFVAAAGKPLSALNPAPTWFYVWFWVGLVPASILFGPVWKVINPLRALASFVEAEPQSSEDDGLESSPRRALPESWGYKIAALSLGIFVWLELVYDRADLPVVVASFIIAYSVIHVVGGARFGPAWFERCDGFEVYSSLMAKLSPLGRRDDGRIVLRNPFNGLATLVQDPALVPVVAVILGSTAFDGITRTQLWVQWSGQTRGTLAYYLLGTAGLAGSIGLVALTYTLAVKFSERFLPRRHGLSGAFVHSLIPIAVGYTIAHYFSLLVFQGQVGILLSSDPLGRGWDLLGLGQTRVNYSAVSTMTIAWVQILSIVGGHVLGVIAAHDRSVEIFPNEFQRSAQYSLLAVMVMYTAGGIALLVGT